MILMIAYTKVDQLRYKKEAAAELTTEQNTEKESKSLLMSDRLIGFSEEEETEAGQAADSDSTAEDSEDEKQILGPAERMDVKKARKEPYGLVAELDYVSAHKISLHGNFGYMVFALEEQEDGTVKAINTHAVTLEELGGLTMGGAAYTDVLAGDGIALIVPGIHNQEIARRRKFLYIEETGEIAGGIVAPAWMMEKMAVNDYKDAVVNEEQTQELSTQLKTEMAKLLYGPAEIEGQEDGMLGFLAADGEALETIWYGIWDPAFGVTKKVLLFP